MARLYNDQAFTLLKPIAEYTDQEVLYLSRFQMPLQWSRRFEYLADRVINEEETVREKEQHEKMMVQLDRANVMKSEALAEAVRRGLREPLKG